jgi:threonine/homoserine/homoserine lactone efflux protein
MATNVWNPLHATAGGRHWSYLRVFDWSFSTDQSKHTLAVMPELSTFLLFATSAAALVLMPGPNLIYIVTRSVEAGRRAGLASMLGVETGTLVHVAAAAFGLSALLASSAVAFEVVRYAGVAYLVFLGVRALRSKEAPAGAPAASTRRTYAEGVLVNLLNPKVSLFFVAFLPQFVDPARGGVVTQVLALGVVFIAIAATLDLLFVIGAGLVGERVRRGRRYAGAVYLGLAAFAAASGGRRS